MSKVVHVEWVDSSSDPGWTYTGQPFPPLARCATVGFFVEQDKERLVLALSRSADGLHCPWGDMISIPVVAITKKRIMK